MWRWVHFGKAFESHAFKDNFSLHDIQDNFLLVEDEPYLSGARQISLNKLACGLLTGYTLETPERVDSGIRAKPRI